MTQVARARGAPDIRFNTEMLAIYDRCAALGFRPVLLRRFVLLNGGVAAAKQLLQQPATTGLERLQKHGQAEFSMEALMLRPEFSGLFTEAECREAQRLLAAARPSRARGRLEHPAMRSPSASDAS